MQRVFKTILVIYIFSLGGLLFHMTLLGKNIKQISIRELQKEFVIRII